MHALYHKTRGLYTPYRARCDTACHINLSDFREVSILIEFNLRTDLIF